MAEMPEQTLHHGQAELPHPSLVKFCAESNNASYGFVSVPLKILLKAMPAILNYVCAVMKQLATSFLAANSIADFCE
jgi:hypothetical protein